MSNGDKSIPYRLTDKAVIRARLNTDREWSLYALADLDDALFEHCDWWMLADGLAFARIFGRTQFVLYFQHDLIKRTQLALYSNLLSS